MKEDIRADEHEGGGASEACRETVDDLNEGPIGQNPGEVLEECELLENLLENSHLGEISPVTIPSFREQK